MSDINQTSSENQLNYTLDSFGMITMERLCKWTKFVGIMNISIGAIYCLSIIILSIPTVIMGVITIVMGTKLTNASSHLRFAVQHKDRQYFSSAMEELRQYFFINGILLLITLILIGLLILMFSLFAGYIMDFLNESGFDYSVSAMGTIVDSIFG